VSGSALRAAVDGYHLGRPDPVSLRRAASEALWLVPLRGGREVYVAEHGGIRWILGFSGADELARFSRDHHELPAACEYATVRGARLLTAFPPALAADRSGSAAPVGVALDVAGERPMLFPPSIDGGRDG
jgi:hypothetical protein